MGVDKSRDPSGEDLAVLGLERFSSSFFCPLDFSGGFFSGRCPASIRMPQLAKLVVEQKKKKRRCCCI